jgi:hypothetical protein
LITLNGTAPNATVEQNLTFDGNTLNVIGDVIISGNLQVGPVTLKYGENLDVDSGTPRTVASVTAVTGYAYFFDYHIRKGINSRTGTVIANYNGTSVNYAEYSTTDLGQTQEVDLSVELVSGEIRLIANTETDNWIIRTYIRIF